MDKIKILALIGMAIAIGRASKKKTKIECLNVQAAYLKDGVEVKLLNLNKPEKTITKTFNKPGDELFAYFGIVSHD